MPIVRSTHQCQDATKGRLHFVWETRWVNMNLGEKEIRSNVAFGSGARGPKSLPCQAVVLYHPPPTCAAQAKLKTERQNLNPSFFWLDFCFLLPKPPTEVSFPLPVFIPVGIHQGLLRCCTNHSQPQTPSSKAHIFSLGFQSTNCTVALQPLSSGQASPVLVTSLALAADLLSP